jgi:hypothetical protein
MPAAAVADQASMPAQGCADQTVAVCVLQEVDIEQELGLEIAHDDEEDEAEEEKHEGAEHHSSRTSPVSTSQCCTSWGLILLDVQVFRDFAAACSLACVQLRHTGALTCCAWRWRGPANSVLPCFCCCPAEAEEQSAAPAAAPKPAAEPEKQLSKKVGAAVPGMSWRLSWHCPGLLGGSHLQSLRAYP